MSTNITGKLTPKQNRYIWFLARDLNIEEDYLRLIVHSVTGTESISSLSRKQAKKIIQKLLTMLHKKNGKNKNIKDIRSYNPSGMQKRKVKELVSAILEYQKISAESLSKRMFAKEYNKLTRQQVQSLIEALKAILRRARNTGKQQKNKKNKNTGLYLVR